MTWTRYRQLGLSVVVLLAACASESTVPSGGGFGAGGSIAGSWVLSFSQQTGGGAVCRFPSLVLSLAQDTGAIRGTFNSYGSAACALEGRMYSGPLGNGTAVGAVLGDTAEINLSLANFHLAGELHSGYLVGQDRWVLGFIGSQIGITPVTGTWTATSFSGPVLSNTPVSITLVPALPVVAVGDSIKVVATIRSASGQALGGAPTLSIPDTTVATISPSGWIRGHGSSAPFTIVASAGAVTTDIVGITLPGAHGIFVSPRTMALNRTHTLQLDVAILDSAGDTLTYVKPSFTSRAPGIATVSSTGLVTASGASLGQAEIIVSTGSLIDSALISVVAIPVSVNLTPDFVVVPPGDSAQLRLLAVDSAGLKVPNPGVTFSSSAPSVVAVSPSGFVRAIDTVGSVFVSASVGALSDTSQVIIHTGVPLPVTVTQVQASGDNWGVAVGRSGAFLVGGSYPGGYNALQGGHLPAFSLPATFDAGGVITSIAFDSSGSRAFFAVDRSAGIGIFDATTNQLVGNISTTVAGVAGSPTGVAVSPDGTHLLVGTTSGWLLLYDAQTYALVDSIPQVAAEQIAFHPTLPLAYLSSGDSVREVSLSPFAVTRTFPADKAFGSTVAPDGSALYIADWGGSEIRIVSLSSGVQVDSIVGIGAPYDVAISAGRDLLYVVDQAGAGYVTVFDRATKAKLISLPLYGVPRRIALDASGTIAIISNQYGFVDFVN